MLVQVQFNFDEVEKGLDLLLPVIFQCTNIGDPLLESQQVVVLGDQRVSLMGVQFLEDDEGIGAVWEQEDPQK